MSDPAPKAELMRALGRLVRGLSALFWGLPLAGLVCTNNIVAEWLRTFGVLAPVVTTGVLFYGVGQFSSFQPQERIWILAVERAKILALVNLGLSPFIYWYSRQPDQLFFYAAMLLFFATGLLFLFNLNLALERLTAMLPDETLRADTRLFTRFNRSMLLAVLLFVGLLMALSQVESFPDYFLGILNWLDQLRGWIVAVCLIPSLAMTMTLIWKIKEVIFSSVFDKPA